MSKKRTSLSQKDLKLFIIRWEKVFENMELQDSFKEFIKKEKYHDSFFFLTSLSNNIHEGKIDYFTFSDIIKEFLLKDKKIYISETLKNELIQDSQKNEKEWTFDENLYIMVQNELSSKIKDLYFQNYLKSENYFLLSRETVADIKEMISETESQTDTMTTDTSIDSDLNSEITTVGEDEDLIHDKADLFEDLKDLREKSNSIQTAIFKENRDPSSIMYGLDLKHICFDARNLVKGVPLKKIPKGINKKLYYLGFTQEGKKIFLIV
jgi:hypothetical protein